jgi:hypothetical protein
MMTTPVTWPPSTRSSTEEDQAVTTKKTADRVWGRERRGEGMEAQVNHRVINVQAASGATE